MVKPLDVQLFLETRTFGELDSEWGINARVSNDGHKFSLNYDMISWTPGHKPSEQCRGLVLCCMFPDGVGSIPHVKNKPLPSFCPGKTVVLAYPMDKFYNSEEGYAAQIDWKSPKLRVEDKLDGTLAILYWDKVIKQWCMSTRSVPDADLSIDGWPDMTFRTLFNGAVLETTGLTFATFTQGLVKEYTYCFELTGPYNRIMVDYKKPGITLLMVRDNKTFQEFDRRDMQVVIPGLNKVPLPKTWSLGSYEEIKNFVNELSPLECEGAVVMVGFDRIKIKSMKWLVANATKTTIGASPRNLVRYVLQGVDDDVKGMLPDDIVAKLDYVKLQVKELFAQTDANFASWKAQAMSRKHFAEFVNLHEGWQGPYFRLFEGRVQSTSGFVSDLLKSDKLSDTFIDGILRHIKVGSHESSSQEVVSG